METKETIQTNSKDEEKGQVSTQAEPKDNKQSHYSEDEKALAERYKIEPKLCRLIAEITSDKVEGRFSQYLNSLQIEQKAEQEAGTAELPEENETLCIDQRTQERIRAFYKNLDPKTKLAIVTFSELQSLEGINFQARKKEEKLLDEIWSNMEDTCIETYHADSDEVAGKDEPWLCGVWETARMIIQNC